MKKADYNPGAIEKKWQKEWAKKKAYKTVDGSKKKKYYILDMFPYPSGEGLHVGHPKGYIATDVISRVKRMQGFNVLHPMGFDAFGLPAENYAIKTKTNPAVSVAKNVDRYKKQLEILGLDYDWSREVNTTDPKYYKWTQWIFLKLLEKGLAFESFEPVNWCPVDKTVLANEDVEDGKCERCGAVVEKKPMRQWVLKITDYAERLLADLDTLDWPESIKESQRNWIGKSEGAEVEFQISNFKFQIPVFTTRPDTLFGATALVLAPEHPLIEKLKSNIENWTDVESYIVQSKQKTEIDRTDASKEKTGIELRGVKAVNPATGENIPVWIADYVLADYGTGAVMAVPAHDERDFAFAKKYNLEIREIELADTKVMVEKYGKWVTKYKLRDWVFSRQRYWGEPIPVLFEEIKQENPNDQFPMTNKNAIPVSEKDLPVELPKVKFYEPTGTGESPLANIENWVEVKIGKGKNAKILRRETNTMPQWAGSSWYYLRYMDPKNNKALVDPKKEAYWNSVDLYVGGAEHATRHLIYARFWHKFLYDIGVVSTEEPFKKLQSVGLIMGPDGRKMSKRFGNVINPDKIVETFGADTLRLYEMFMGPFDQAIPWDERNIVGVRRFLEKVWRLTTKMSFVDSTNTNSSTKGILVADEKLESLLHKTIKKVTEDIETMSFNTAISAMMIFLNEVESAFSRTESASAKGSGVTKKDWEMFLKILAPFAPHMTEEIWHSLGHKTLIVLEDWPTYDPKKLIDSEIKIIVQVNSKMRGMFTVPAGTAEIEITAQARALPELAKWLEGKEIKKEIYVPGKLVNFVVV